MANETEITASNSASEERPQRLPVFPARPDDSPGGNGSDVPAQYKAIHEAQLLHEETIRQIREELRAYKKRLGELSDGSAGQRTGQMDAVLLRLSELERKIGQGAPDPLLNEIVHRLASLENAGSGRGGNDPRVEGLLSQVETLRRQLNDPAPSDPRTDDVVLRIAAVEGSLRRAHQELSPDRLEDLERLVSGTDARTQQLLDQRLGAVQQEVARSTREFADGADQRIAALEQQLEAAASGSLEALQERLDEIELSLQQQSGSSETVLARFQSVEARLRELSDAVVLRSDLAGLEQKIREVEKGAESGLDERLEARLAAIETRQPSHDPRLDELAVRLATVEDRSENTKSVDTDTFQDLVQQVGRLELQLPRPEQQQVWEERLAELESRWTAAQSETQEFGAVVARVEALESHGTQVFESRLTEMTARLRAVELKGDAAAAEDPKVDRLAARLDQLELTGSSGDTAKQLSDLRERVAELQKRNKADIEEKLEQALSRLNVLESQASESDASAPALERLGARLSDLEARASDTVEDPRVGALERQLVSLRAELGEIRSTAEQVQAGDQLNQLASQLEELRKSGPQQHREFAELRARVDALITAESAPDGVWREMAVRIEELERLTGQNTAETGASELSPELLQRLERLESKSEEHADPGLSSDIAERIFQRLDTVEHNVGKIEASSSAGLSEALGAEITSRFELVDRRLSEVETTGGPAEIAEALQQESERWSQWARETVEEIGDLRRQVEDLQEPGAGAEAGVSQQLLATLSEKIASGLAGSEIKAVQTHVYRLYFAVFLLVGMVLTSLMLNK